MGVLYADLVEEIFTNLLGVRDVARMLTKDVILMNQVHEVEELVEYTDDEEEKEQNYEILAKEYPHLLHYVPDLVDWEYISSKKKFITNELAEYNRDNLKWSTIFRIKGLSESIIMNHAKHHGDWFVILNHQKITVKFFNKVRSSKEFRKSIVILYRRNALPRRVKNMINQLL